LVVYKGFADERGIPKLHGMNMAPYFTKEFWQGKYPMWQDYDAWKSLGLPEIRSQKEKAFVPAPPAVKLNDSTTSVTASDQPSIFGQLIYGLVIGISAYLLFLNRQRILALFKK
jgi:hypothetical protein